MDDVDDERVVRCSRCDHIYHEACILEHAGIIGRSRHHAGFDIDDILDLHVMALIRDADYLCRDCIRPDESNRSTKCRRSCQGRCSPRSWSWRSAACSGTGPVTSILVILGGEEAAKLMADWTA